MRPALSVPLLLLAAACQRHDPGASAAGESGAKDARSAAAGAASPNAVAIDVPGFKAQVTLPSIEVPGKNTSLDGLKLYPGTRLTGIRVASDTGERGTVTMNYVADASPAAVLAYYREAAPRAGFTLAAAAPDRVAGRKGAKSAFDIAVRPDGAGSAGTIAVSGQ